jgi:NitT/TauT family transport system ATP-binding protein
LNTSHGPFAQCDTGHWLRAVLAPAANTATHRLGHAVQLKAAAMTQHTIQVENVRKIYQSGKDAVEAVSGVSFEVEQGEFVAILGPSGCGKSTLLMMCGGLESITSGRITIEGEPVVQPRAQTGVMFQDSTLLPWKTVMENIVFPIRMQRRPMAEYWDRARSLVHMAGLQGFEQKKPHQLSGGMRQRVAICRALVTDPDILLMDEPFSALDAMTRDEMNEALLRIWDRYRKTGLFVTHSIREAVYLADRVLVMTRRPATIVEDLRIPFGRPRDAGIVDTAQFTEICAHLRSLIEPRRRNDTPQAA